MTTPFINVIMTQKTLLTYLITHFLLHSYRAIKRARMNIDIHLRTFWPILKVLQILGVSPIKKSTVNTCGFEATKTGIYLFHIILILLFANGGHIVCCYFVIHQYDLGIWALLDVLFGLNGSLIDNIDLIGIEVLMVISSFSIILGNLSLKSLFIELLDLFHTSGLYSVKHTFQREKITLFSIIFSWALCMVSFDVGFTVTLMKEFDINNMTIVLFAFSHLFYVTINITPIIGFLIMYR